MSSSKVVFLPSTEKIKAIKAQIQNLKLKTCLWSRSQNHFGNQKWFVCCVLRFIYVVFGCFVVRSISHFYFSSDLSGCTQFCANCTTIHKNVNIFFSSHVSASTSISCLYNNKQLIEFAVKSKKQKK